MNATKKKVVGLAGAGAGLATFMTSPALAAPDPSPWWTASGNQCWARWWASTNVFEMVDNDLEDDDYCYVQYGWSENQLNNRISNPQDIPGYQYYAVDVGTNKTIWWKVCKERQNDPDICSSVRSDST